MPTFQYSRRAERDIANVLAYTRDHWGQAQADTYFQQLADTLNLLARYQELGRRFSSPRPHWRRFEHASHIILYRPVAGGIRIERIIHNRQLMDTHLH